MRVANASAMSYHSPYNRKLKAAIVIRRKSRWALAALVVLFTAIGCDSTGKQYGIGSQVTTAPRAEGGSVRPEEEKDIDVLLVDYDKALEIAYKVAKSKFGEETIERADDGVLIKSRSFLLGDANATIMPKLVTNLGTRGGHGYTYRYRANGVGYRASLIPGYVTTRFFEGLKEYRIAHRLKSSRFEDDRGVTDAMPNDFPVTREKFTDYIDEKRNLSLFEGIWSDHGGENILGIVADRSDPRFNYKAFVISSKNSNWRPGDVKIKFNRLRSNGVTVSEFWASDKHRSGVTWNAEPEYIVSLNSVREPYRSGQIALVKTYPTSLRGHVEGVGTGWAITADGLFVTNAHVIRDADEIRIGRRKNAAKARVIAVDERLDLAILKIESAGRSFRPLPLAAGNAPTGAEITVIGYPLAFELGDDTRVTAGVISAQSGLRKDVTRYQVSAAIQGGNSGGPVLNDHGQVVGIVVTGIVRTDVENVNFAVKVAYLRPLLEQAGIAYPTAGSPTALTSQELFERYGASVLPVWTNR